MQLLFRLIFILFANGVWSARIKRKCSKTDISIYEHENHISCIDQHCWDDGNMNPFLKKTYNLEKQTVTCWITGETKEIACFEKSDEGMLVKGDEDPTDPWCFIKTATAAPGLKKVYLPMSVNSSVMYLAEKLTQPLEYECAADFFPVNRSLVSPKDVAYACRRMRSESKNRPVWTWISKVYACLHRSNDTIYEYRTMQKTRNVRNFCTMRDKNPKRDTVSQDNRHVLLYADKEGDSTCFAAMEGHEHSEVYLAREKIVQICPSSRRTGARGVNVMKAGARFRYKSCNATDGTFWDTACPCDCAGDDAHYAYGSNPVMIAAGELCTKYYSCPTESRESRGKRSVEKGVKVCYGMKKKVHHIETCYPMNDPCFTVPRKEMDSGRWNPDIMMWQCDDKKIKPRGRLFCDPNGRWTYPNCTEMNCVENAPSHVRDVQKKQDDTWFAFVDPKVFCGSDAAMMTRERVECRKGVWDPLEKMVDCCFPTDEEDEEIEGDNRVPPLTSVCGGTLRAIATPSSVDVNGCALECPSPFVLSKTTATCKFTKCVLSAALMDDMCGPGAVCKLEKNSNGTFVVKKQTTLTVRKLETGGLMLVNNATGKMVPFTTHWHLIYRRVKTQTNKWIYHTTTDAQEKMDWPFPKLNSSFGLLPCGSLQSTVAETDETTNTFVVKRKVVCGKVEVMVPCDAWTLLQDVSANEPDRTKDEDGCDVIKKNIQFGICPGVHASNRHNRDVDYTSTGDPYGYRNKSGSAEMATTAKPTSQVQSTGSNATTIGPATPSPTHSHEAARCIQCTQQCGTVNNLSGEALWTDACGKQFKMPQFVALCVQSYRSFCSTVDCSDCE